MIFDQPIIKPSGDRALRVTFGDERSLRVNRPVLAMRRVLEAAPPAEITELVPAYASLTVMYDPTATNPGHLEEHLDRTARQAMDNA